jgi:hypothetical protein
MDRTHHILVAALSSMLAAGCLADPLSREGEAGRAEAPAEHPNALNPNALNPNALNPNALNPNALNPNALNPNALNPNALIPNALDPAALQAILDPGPTGDLSRQLLQYTVSCALGPSQSFSFTRTDAEGAVVDETYTGLMGLATGWATGPLDFVGQQWVSACLASRLNWYQVQVILSSRGLSTALSTTAAERAAYSNREGAFFGNVFAAQPALYACHYAPDDGASRAVQRDCAAGHLNPDGSVSACGVVQLAGSCDDVCTPVIGMGRFYPICSAGGQYYLTVITTYTEPPP